MPPSTGEASISPPPPRPVGSGSGFGGTADETKRKRRGKERSAVVWRSPIERKDRKFPQEPQQSVNESAFLLTWLGLGSLILVEGLALAASVQAVLVDARIDSYWKQNLLVIVWRFNRFLADSRRISQLFFKQVLTTSTGSVFALPMYKGDCGLEILDINRSKMILNEILREAAGRASFVARLRSALTTL